MPQMMPLNWLMLFIYFIVLFFLFNILVYFNYSKKLMKLNTSSYKISNNWKW